jgi:DNA-directed RNA polymerase specialized sigma24 family protein
MFIFVGRFYMADPLAKIAKELRCSLATVKREIAAIKEGLKKHLESEGYDL